MYSLVLITKFDKSVSHLEQHFYLHIQCFLTKIQFQFQVVSSFCWNHLLSHFNTEASNHIDPFHLLVQHQSVKLPKHSSFNKYFHQCNHFAKCSDFRQTFFLNQTLYVQSNGVWARRFLMDRYKGLIVWVFWGRCVLHRILVQSNLIFLIIVHLLE
jgi:hypothetical protein